MLLLLFILYFLICAHTCFSFLCFFFNDTATTEIYTLSLHDALPICTPTGDSADRTPRTAPASFRRRRSRSRRDRKSTRLNSSHANISYAVFCLKKKKKKKKKQHQKKQSVKRSQNPTHRQHKPRRVQW